MQVGGSGGLSLVVGATYADVFLKAGWFAVGSEIISRGLLTELEILSRLSAAGEFAEFGKFLWRWNRVCRESLRGQGSRMLLEL